MLTQTLQIHSHDNIVVALQNLEAGTIIQNSSGTYSIKEKIPAKQKFAAADIEKGNDIIMYGVLVGRAVERIEKGKLISTKNIQHASQNFELKQRKTDWHKPDVSRFMDKTFMGFHRADGSVGVANYWLIIPLVFCENKNVDVLHEALLKALGYKPSQTYYEKLVGKMLEEYKSGNDDSEQIAQNVFADYVAEEPQKTFPHIDGIKVLNHTMGCAGTKDDTAGLCGLLAGYITHPNVAGATVLSLGCQNAQITILMDEINRRDKIFSKPLMLLEQQQIGNESKMLEKAIVQTFAGLIEANKNERRPAPINKLCVGLECGGSDGFSGISANPAVGYFSDLLVAIGGSVILSEFPELCGVEQGLSDRCVDDDIANRFIQLMKAYQEKARLIGSGFESNPSAGNIRDGLITDAIKSAGAAKKGGSSPVTDVLDYPEKIKKSGLNLLCTPGSDIESTTAEVGSGATIVLFTTGLGTPTGNPVAPVVKLSTNTALYRKMNDIIDIDTGTIIEGTETIEQTGERILDYVIKLAGGEIQVKADISGHDEFIPWKRGISL